MKQLRSFLDAWNRDVEGAILIRNESRIAETKSAIELLSAVFHDPETELRVEESENKRALIFNVKDASWMLDQKQIVNLLRGLSVADRIEINATNDERVWIAITFENCFLKIGNIRS